MKKNKYNNQQQGFTLVEIMLAITLSLILIAGVIQVYLSGKTSFQVQNQLARLQENQRISIDFLQRDIRQAGFVPYGETPIPVNQRIVVEDDVGPNNSDRITVRYTSDTDCLGVDTPNGIAVNQYYIENEPPEDGEPIRYFRLMCNGNGVSDNGAPVAPAPIADGVSNMQILLGENTIFTNSNETAQMPSADFYLNVSSEDPVVNMNRVVAIRIALLVRTEEPIKQQDLLQTHTLLDHVAQDTDRIKRQVITTTIPLRNGNFIF